MNFIFFRPDIPNALENEGVKIALPRYRKILVDGLPAKFLILKTIDTGKLPKKEDEMWRLHKKSMQKFSNALEEIDKKGLRHKDLGFKDNSLLDLKIKLVEKIMERCHLCERRCGVNRFKGEKGECRVGNECLISSIFVHMGEESFISPSLTCFFMGCTFHCQFCQNWSISQWHEDGERIEPDILAKIVDEQALKVRNLNLVGGEPTPSLLFILEALKEMKSNIPIVWNSNMYMSLETMEILNGIVDVYLSDWKYGNDECARRLSKVNNYWEIISRNHDISFKQSELTIRHLVMPNHIECCTKPILEYIAENYGKKVIVNVMDQYRPEYLAHKYIDIARIPNDKEIASAINYAEKLRLNYIT
ncbi:MAG: radical SAM protein [Candidatus Parvarchaeota archaeon]|nr:radical SAM protein [Candidatus Jingweiarchaeum tengchongense]MCW1298278.1 radical SAM protein [Candidatus Jingweiarchaeum tengchongense]MCW1300369.1 radical SAM protein [Candidatus Jingweiarchaeum tengchongense]MCW1304786.1 radical SAM protein [Candidatus Jingweiarchaeum tengchongense]MCW1305376.1 radical SAM protein [Candidatus Jingweiarchaeum tengchongense]